MVRKEEVLDRGDIAILKLWSEGAAREGREITRGM